MKLLLLDLYRLIYRMTNRSKLAIFIAVAYVAILNLVAFYGLGILLQGMFGISSVVHVLYSRQLFPFTVVAMILINIWIMSPFKNIKKEKNQKLSFWGILMYTGVALIIYAYTRYGSTITF